MNFIEKPFEKFFKNQHIFEQSNLHYLEQLFQKVYHNHKFDLFQLIYNIILSIDEG